MFTARGRESPPQECRKGECEITVMTSAPDGIRTRPRVGEPWAAAWRGWTGAGEERHSEHPQARGAKKLHGWRGPDGLTETVVQEQGWGASHWPHQVD